MQDSRRNVEIKLRLPGGAPRWASLLQRLGAQDGGVLQQEDVFFRVPCGRLKLRFQTHGPAQLIAYTRADEAALRVSRYRVVPCEEGLGLRRLLADTLGEIGTVRKRRQLYLLENVRVHLDEVDGLGSFLEIEAVVDDGHGEAACFEAARDLLQRLDLARSPVESLAYIDLLEQSN